VHVVFQYDKKAGQQEIWIDGRFICSRSSGPYQGKSGETIIGGSPVWNNVPCKDFMGFIRDVRIYDRALTAAEIRAALVQLLPKGKPAPPSSKTVAVPLAGESSFNALAAEVGISFPQH